MSVSELLTWQKCRRQWGYRYAERLAPLVEKRSWQMASGTAVHYVVETWCRDFPGEVPDLDSMKLRTAESLREDFATSDDPNKLLARFGPGVMRALLKIPEWLWKADWFVERDLTGQFGNVELRGRTDLVYQEGNIVTLVDVKTTAVNPIDYMLWDSQNRYYAAMLQQAHPDKLIEYRYFCVPTTGVKPVEQQPPWLFTRKQQAATVDEIVRLAGEMDENKREPRYSRVCAWCPFKAICTILITGGDGESVKRDEFRIRPMRN
tara:strand:+ start:1460 stop:2248 length:789 start_codon:yes stop_codon:yes gene_type:complete